MASDAEPLKTIAFPYYVDHIPYDKVISMATHISTDIDFRPVSYTHLTLPTIYSV